MPYHSVKKQMGKAPKTPIKPKPSKPIAIPAKPKPKPNTLTKKQEAQLKEAEKTHSKKHINLMKKLMKSGMTFTQAHKEALKEVGN